MPRPSCLALLLTLAATVVRADDEPAVSFRPLAPFVVPDGGSAETLAAWDDGERLVYTNAIAATFGTVDISDPSAPLSLGETPVDGSPTSVTVVPGRDIAVVAVQRAELCEGLPPVLTPGVLLFVDLRTGDELGTIEAGIGPDSVAAAETPLGTVLVVAVENQPIILDADGNWVDDDAPGNPDDTSEKGFVRVVLVDWSDLSASTVTDIRFDDPITLLEAGLEFVDDPQPEYVSIRGDLAAVTLQENNGVALIDLSDPSAPTLAGLFGLGRAKNRRADLRDDERIEFDDVYPADALAEEPLAGVRMPDAIAWNAAGTALFTADEGDLSYTGGRGWSSWDASGRLLWEEGVALEAEAVARGHYPDGRSDARGIETEGIASGVFFGHELVFVTSERGSFVAAYIVDEPRNPRLVQLLPTGIRPEVALALESRGLLLTADEGDDGFATISIFAAVSGAWEAPADRPILRSAGLRAPWSALSGLAADPIREGTLYAVPDSALVSSIYRIDLRGSEARIREEAPVTLDGAEAFYDLEGIAIDTSLAAPRGRAGYWLCSEGNGEFGDEGYTPNLLVQVDSRGRVLQEVRLPAEIDPPDYVSPEEPPAEGEPDPLTGKVRSNGFEGVTVSTDGRYLLAAIQRGFLGESANEGILYTRIGRYDLLTDSWSFFLYPLEPTATKGDWVGLSEIVNLGSDIYAVIERDKQFGSTAAIKQVYAFRLDGVEPFEGVVDGEVDLTGQVIRKFLIADVLEEFRPFEKIEGMAITGDHRLWIALDNDGGELESRLVRVAPRRP